MILDKAVNIIILGKHSEISTYIICSATVCIEINLLVIRFQGCLQVLQVKQTSMLQVRMEVAGLWM